jgi:hypothetical protein
MPVSTSSSKAKFKYSEEDSEGNRESEETEQSFGEIRPLDSSMRGQSSSAAFMLENLRGALHLTEEDFEKRFMEPAFAAHISTSISFVKRSMSLTDSQMAAANLMAMNKMHKEDQDTLDFLPSPDVHEENRIFQPSDVSQILGEIKKYYMIDDDTHDNDLDGDVNDIGGSTFQIDLNEMRSKLEELTALLINK